MLHLEITTTVEEIVLEEMIETLNQMGIEISLVITFQIAIIFKEKFQEEIIIMPQNLLKNIIIYLARLVLLALHSCLKTIFNTLTILLEFLMNKK